ncbi:tetratricopeptide repeat protein [Ktedonospora formicarum]|uniref:MalT-like TPR region domain-containing protein n=1 Tax=Ktedonospora formicarum TaxID=2778364 RepID=A0A8J3MVG4_9CHLR|nr:hypothetical protein KSX_58010 [Ktedonospora formicarum]
MARRIGHSQRISALLANLGASEMELGRYVQAETYFQEGLTVARCIGHREWQSILLLNLGETSIAQNHISQAETYLHNALSLSREIGRPQIIAKVLYDYGNVQLKKGEIHEAHITFDEMLMNIPGGDKELRLLVYYGQARVAALRGDVHKAVALGEQCAKGLENMGHGSAQEVRIWLERLLLNAQ